MARRPPASLGSAPSEDPLARTAQNVRRVVEFAFPAGGDHHGQRVRAMLDAALEILLPACAAEFAALEDFSDERLSQIPPPGTTTPSRPRMRRLERPDGARIVVQAALRGLAEARALTPAQRRAARVAWVASTVLTPEWRHSSRRNGDRFERDEGLILAFHGLPDENSVVAALEAHLHRAPRVETLRLVAVTRRLVVNGEEREPLNPAPFRDLEVLARRRLDAKTDLAAYWRVIDGGKVSDMKKAITRGRLGDLRTALERAWTGLADRLVETEQQRGIRLAVPATGIVVE